jgi:hydroxyacylglutathione hydrolase
VQLRQFVLEGLGNSSYLLAPAEGGQAAVVDPDRDVAPYLLAARDLGLTITLVLETHLHNDFVSGARELAARTGATVGASAAGELRYPHRPLRDGNRLPLGSLEIEVMATPGHTPEHICFLTHEGGRPVGLFSGGSLLVGSVARSDLFGPELARGLAEQMYHSLHERILALSDHVAVYPTHGAGSFCTAAVSTARATTIGQERRNSRLLQLDSPGAFVQEALRGLPPYPRYFRRMRAINQSGPPVLGGLPQLAPLEPEAATPTDERLLVDTRDPLLFSGGHVPDSISIGMSMTFGVWVGWLLPHDVPLAFVTDDPEIDEEVSRQLVRIGYETVLGSLKGGLEQWRREGRPVNTTPVVSVADLRERRAAHSGPLVVDVRHEVEWQAGHLPEAVHIPLPELEERAERLLPRSRPVAVHCAGSFRSGVAVSLLERLDYPELYHVRGGFDAWRAAGFEIARPPAPATAS